MSYFDLLNRKKNLTNDVVAIDSYRNIACVFSNNSMKTKSFAETNVDTQKIYGVKWRHVLNIEIDSTLSGDALENDISDKVRRNLNLGEFTEYVIKFLTKENGRYDAYAVSFDTLQLSLENVLESLKYLEYAVPQPFLFEALYTGGILPISEAQCFIFLDTDDAFLAVYQQGKYSFTRGIGKYNLSYLATQYNNLLGSKKMRDDQFFNKLKTDGVSDEFRDVFNGLVDFIVDMFNNSNLGKIGIDKVFLGTQIGTIPGLSELVNQKLLISTQDFDFNTHIEGADLDPSCMNSLMYYYTTFCAKSGEILNFSPFLRPPDFLKRDGGQLIAAVGAACVIGLIFPLIEISQALYYSGLNAYTNWQLTKRNEELASLEPNFKSNENSLKTQSDRIAKLESNIDVNKKLLDDSLNKKINYKSKSEFLYDISNFINSSDVKTTGIVIGGDSGDYVGITLLSNDDKQITQLIENIDSSVKYAVTTKQITLKEAPKVTKDDARIIVSNPQYESNITIGLLK